MHIQTTHALATRSDPFFSTMPHCPSCRAQVIAANASEFIDTGEIRHHWTCDDCGQVFSTTVTLY
jgi:transposase-like protein